MMKLYSCVLCVLILACIVTGCGGSATQHGEPSSSLTNQPPQIVEQPTSELPSIANLPRTASGYRKVNGSAFIQAAGAQIVDHAVKLSLSPATGDPDEGNNESLPEVAPEPQQSHFAYAIYRFEPIIDPVVGLKIQASSHNISPMWIGLADYAEQHWVFPFEPELSSAELWSSSTGVDLHNYTSLQEQFTLAVVLADDQEDVIIYSVELVTSTSVDELVVSHNLTDLIRLTWQNPNRAVGTAIYRRVISEPTSTWSLITDEPLSSETVQFDDIDIEVGNDYEYAVSSAYGPPFSPEKWLWSTAETAVGTMMVAHADLDLPAGIDIQAQPVNWYNNLGFIGFTSEPLQIAAFQLTSFPPGPDWRWYTATDGLAETPLQWPAGSPEPMTTHLFTSENNPYITVCYSASGGIYSQIAGIDELGNVTWQSPVEIRQGPHQVVASFQMSRRIGLLTWNTELQQLEVIDSMDQIGKYWFDFDEWNWLWRTLDCGLPDGAVDSMYSDAGELLCFVEDSTDQLRVFMLIGGDWQDHSPGFTASPSPKVTNLVSPPIVPGFGVVYITQDRQSIKLLHREMLYPWQTDDQTEIYSTVSEDGISELAIHCPAGYSSFNYIAFIEGGNIYLSTCNNWALKRWSPPKLVDDAGDCEQIEFIRIGSDNDYHYGVYLTYFTRNEDDSLRFNFRAIDSRFIPEP